MSAGQGQRSNTWSAPAGNCYATYLFAIPMELAAFSMLLASISISETIEAHYDLKQPPKLKWVNDVYFGDDKVCGILTKGSSQGKKFIVSMGIGVNLNVAP